MSDSTRVISRFVVVLFFIAAGVGIYGVMTHNRLQAAQQHLSALSQERDTLRDRLMSSEKTATESAAVAKICAVEVETYKSRVQSAEAALESAKGKKTPRPTSG